MRAGSSATTPISPRVTPAEQQKFGISWSLKLTNEGAYIFALISGLIIANFLPRFAGDQVRGAAGLYIKIAIVILGGFFAVTAAGKLSLASSLILRGVAAIVEAYLIYWAVVYLIARTGLASPANGRRRWPRAFRSAGSRRPSPPAALSGRGRSFRCWCRRWS